MENLSAILEREGALLDTLLFKLVETNLLLQAGETRFIARATREVERVRTRTREVDLIRATTVGNTSPDRPNATLRELAAQAPEPWPGILRDHHSRLAQLVADIEVVAHRNAEEARRGLEELRRRPVLTAAAGAPGPAGADEELAYLSRGAAYESVLGTAARLRMPGLLTFLH